MGVKSLKKFSKQTKNRCWITKYEVIKNNVQVNDERVGTGFILLISMAMYIAVMSLFAVPFGLFGVLSSPLFFLLVRQYINAVYSSNKDKAMLGIGENELHIYFSKKKQTSFISYKQVEKVVVTYKSEDKSSIEIKDKSGIIVKTELQTAFIKKFLTSISERNKETLIELVSFPENYQRNNLFWQLQQNPLLRLV